ncbi:MAG: class I SAM-dependent methyltransferase [Candidatus Omnitrophica bacterium]|nr:class I SAM-dependent methyltransferase [Candidatus Omnitrophota bacterium]
MPSVKLIIHKLFPWTMSPKVRRFFYLGLKLKCPICGWYLRKMLLFGLKHRPNAQCPNCFSLERHRLMWLYLKNKTDFFTRRLKVLHIAPEPVFSRIFKSMSNLDYVNADLLPDRAMKQMDITDIAEPDNQYDVILCCHVLEHIPDDRKAMRELWRVLRPGGWAMLQVPVICEKTFEDPSIVSPQERERVYGWYEHVRKYGKDYKDRLEEAGFKVKVDGYVRTLGKRNIHRYRLTEHEDVYLCTKPE